MKPIHFWFGDEVLPAPSRFSYEIVHWPIASVICRPEKSDTCVLDVRDDDFRGGHIPGCLNIWSDEFADDDDVDSIIQKHALGQYKMIVVTCFMSQQRGPFCARR